MDSKGREVDWGAVAMAATVMIVEGYDLVIYGNTLPIMLKDAGLGLSVGAAGVVGSAVFVGMLLGGLSVGLLVRRLGVRNMLMLGIGCFSLAMAGAALAHQPWALGFLRLLAGWGLGAVMPACMANAAECHFAVGPVCHFGRDGRYPLGRDRGQLVHLSRGRDVGVAWPVRCGDVAWCAPAPLRLNVR